MHGATADLVTALVALLLIAAAAQAWTRRWRFPFSIALLLIGLALAELARLLPSLFAPIRGLELSSHLILFVFLPTLIFESASHLPWRELKRDLGPVLTLAVPGLVLSTVLIGGLLHLAAGFPLLPALLLGAILSAIDPVAVIALFQRLGAPRRLTVLVEGESLFNDATSIVVARMLVAMLAAGTLSGAALWSGLADFVLVFAGGVVVGWLLGEAFAWLLGRVDSDPAIEITLTTVLAYLSFLVAEQWLHVSGVMATVTAGLSYGNRGWMRVSPSVRGYLNHFWEYMAFVATALIFLMVGLSADLRTLQGHLPTLAWLIAGMLLARAVIVYGLVALTNRWPGTQAVSRPYQTVMFWGGLRGAIALALVLSLPESLALKDTLTALVVGAMLFTLLVQGLSMDRLVRWLKLDRPPLIDRYGELETRGHAARHALARLPDLAAGGLFSAAITRRLREDYQRQAAAADLRLSRLRDGEMSQADAWSLLQLRLLNEEQQQLRALFDHGHLDERVFRHLLAGNGEWQDRVRSGEGLPRSRLPPAPPPRLQALLRALPFVAERLALKRVAAAYQWSWALHSVADRLLADWAGLSTGKDPAAAQLRALVEHWRQEHRRRLDETAEQFPEFVNAMQRRHAERLALLAEIEAIEQWARYGRLPSGSAERLLQQRRRRLGARRGLEIGELQLDPAQLLQQVPLFAALDAEARQRLTQRLQVRTVTADEDILVQGQAGDSLYVIARGVVRVIVDDGVVARDVASLMAGDFFGEMALLHDEPRRATVRSVTPCTLYELKRSAYAAAAAEYPQIAEAVARADAERRERLAASRAT